MLKQAFFALSIAVAHAAPAPAAAQDPREQRRVQCLGWLQSGYPTGIDEASCTRDFNLPSAFLVKCARAARIGYASEVERDACAVFYAAEAERASAGYVRR